MISQNEKREEKKDSSVTDINDIFGDLRDTSLGINRDYTKYKNDAGESNKVELKEAPNEFDDYHETLLGIRRDYTRRGKA
ncbi:MAG: hypothetical protein ACP5RF_00620 [Candidatus Micrarchaeia archaeon]